MAVRSDIRWFRVTLPAMVLVCLSQIASAADEDFVTM